MTTHSLTKLQTISFFFLPLAICGGTLNFTVPCVKKRSEPHAAGDVTIPFKFSLLLYISPPFSTHRT